MFNYTRLLVRKNLKLSRQAQTAIVPSGNALKTERNGFYFMKMVCHLFRSLLRSAWVLSTTLEKIDNKRQRIERLVVDVWWPKMRFLYLIREDRPHLPKELLANIGVVGVIWDSKLPDINTVWKKEKKQIKSEEGEFKEATMKVIDKLFSEDNSLCTIS